MAVRICQFLFFSLDLYIFYTLGGATKSEVTSLEQCCNQVSDAPKSTGRVDCGVVVTTAFKRCLTICHLSVPSHTGLSDAPALGPSLCAASPTGTDGLCLPQGLVHKEQVPCKFLLSWRMNEGGRE